MPTHEGRGGADSYPGERATFHCLFYIFFHVSQWCDKGDFKEDPKGTIKSSDVGTQREVLTRVSICF